MWRCGERGLGGTSMRPNRPGISSKELGAYSCISEVYMK